MTIYEEIALAEERAANGDADAMYSLAVIHYIDSRPPVVRGEGIHTAIKWASMAFEAGHRWAGTLLGHIYSNKSFETFDLEKALKAYEESAARGDADAVECLLKIQGERG